MQLIILFHSVFNLLYVWLFKKRFGLFLYFISPALQFFDPHLKDSCVSDDISSTDSLAHVQRIEVKVKIK